MPEPDNLFGLIPGEFRVRSGRVAGADDSPEYEIAEVEGPPASFYAGVYDGTFYGLGRYESLEDAAEAAERDAASLYDEE